MVAMLQARVVDIRRIIQPFLAQIQELPANNVSNN
jgi:hypothetical protein